LAEARDLRQYVHGRIHRQGEGSGEQGTRILQQFFGFGLDHKQALGNGQQAFTQIGQAHRTLVAVKQQHAEALFQFAHLVGNRRLGQEQAFGGPGKTAVNGHRMEGFELGMGNRHGTSS